MKYVGKQSLSWLLTLASLFTLLVVMPIPAQAETGESFFDDSTGVDITFTILTERRNTGTVEVSYVHFWNDVTLLYIPPIVTYNGKEYTVTGIGDGSLKGSPIKRIVMPDTVKRIGTGAFWNSELESVEIPEGVLSIGERAFQYCANLKSVILPDSITIIGEWAFEGCDKLASVILPEVTLIGPQAFSMCNSLTSIEVPASLAIGDYAFEGCESLTDVILSDGLTRVFPGMFSNCSSLASIIIPDSVIDIGEYAFQGCSTLTQFIVDDNNPFYSSDGGILYDKEKAALLSYPSAQGDCKIPEGVTHIGNTAFFECQALSSVEIPDSVTSIGDWAFAYCNGLTGVEIHDGVTSIGDGAFFKSSSLTRIEVPCSVTNIGHRTFAFCFQLRSIVFAGDAPAMEREVFYEIPSDAIAYVYPWAVGFPAEGELWNGLTIKYRDVPAASLDTGVISMLASGCAANLPVNVKGNNLLGKELIFSIKSESGNVVYTSEKFVGADDFSVILKLDKETLTLPAGIYTLEAAVSGAAIASATIKIAEAGPELWLVEAAATPYNGANALVVRFSETPFVRTFNGAVAVDGIALVNPVYSWNVVYLPDVDVTANHTIKITGVKYPELFPSYSFTFTAEYIA